MRTLSTFYLVIYWKQNVHHDSIFLCSIVLPPVGYSSTHQYHCCQLTTQLSCGSNFYRTFEVFSWVSLAVNVSRKLKSSVTPLWKPQTTQWSTLPPCQLLLSFARSWLLKWSRIFCWTLNVFTWVRHWSLPRAKRIQFTPWHFVCLTPILIRINLPFRLGLSISFLFQISHIQLCVYIFSFPWCGTWATSSPMLFPALYLVNTAVAQWLRCCATNRKVAGSIPASVSGFPSDRTMALGSTHPLTEMSTRSISWG